MNFNIFYLNFSKVYETKMLLNNIVPEKITKEKSFTSQSNNEIGFSSDVFSLKHGESKGEYFRLTETLKVKEEKAVVLKDILKETNSISNFDNVNEGDLIKIDNVSIEFYDDGDTERMLSLFSKDAISGMIYEGFDVSNFILKYFNDSAYHLKCKFNGENIVFKIPIENNTEFESKYSINDLLIGKLSIVGIYKGRISEIDFKRSNFSAAINQQQNTPQQDSSNSKIMSSSHDEPKNDSPQNTKIEDDLLYIDIFAIIQNINFKREKSPINEKRSLLDKIKQWMGR
ncbi:hypothetical protein [Methanobrevibacter sp. UBA188]|uniref:hypothetical protein n=2 Tax=unclassified Methanobrevibacter TaxID=2638681 RepID=UPI0025D2B2C9|nr:hypothetical protein [Methanobrevibacter sp. UBA188]